MQLEEILSAAVAAVDVNGIELESIPSPAVVEATDKTSVHKEKENADQTEVELEDSEPVNCHPDRRVPSSQGCIKGHLRIRSCMKDEVRQKCDRQKGLDMPILIPLEREMSRLKGEKQSPCGNEVSKQVSKGNSNVGELHESIHPPVEVSFFDIGDDNLVITSQQALEMFETVEVSSSMDIRDSNASNDAVGKFSQYGFQQNQFHYDSFHSKNYNASIVSGNEVSNSVQMNGNPESFPYDLNIEVPMVSNTEEVIGFSQEVEVESTESLNHNPSSEEIITMSDAKESPQYTMLTPPMELTSVSSAVSGALRTIGGFDSTANNMVDNTIDSENQFVVKVSAPGMDLTIPNNELCNHITSSSNSELHTVSDIDIMNAFNINSNSEQFNEVCDQTTTERQPIKHNSYQDEYSESNKPRKRKRSDSFCVSEEDSKEASSNSKRDHSSVMAALRESIFRSKARKIVNLLGKDSEGSDSDPPKREKHNKQSKSSPKRNFNSKEIAFHKQRHAPPATEISSPGVKGDSSSLTPIVQNKHRHKEKETEVPHTNQHHHRNTYSSHCCSRDTHQRHSQDGFRNATNGCSSNLNCSSIEEPTRHQSNCRRRCCSMHERKSRECCRETARVQVQRRQEPSCGSCRCKRRRSGGGEPFMMVRPEDLPSLLKRNSGDVPPIVMMQPDALNNTDGDPLKVQLVYLIRSIDDKKMSGSSTHSSFSHLDMTPSTLNPSCEGNGDGSCPSRCYTTSCRSSFNSSNSNSPRNGILPHQEPEWVEKEPRSAPTHLHHSYEDKHTTDLEPQQPIQDPEAYLRKPIEEWGYADVIFFLMEACKELRINPGDVKFKRSDDGTALLRMSPSDFEVLAPSRGQVLYDYFINFKTQHYMASEERNLHPSYTYENNCSDVHHSAYLQNDGSQSMHHQDHHIMERSYSHNHIESPCESSQDLSVPYSQYPNSPYSCSTSSYKNSSNSPTNEYVPQGSQYLPQTPSSEPSHRKSYDLPSAAWKTFPPLHNYDEPLSDPDEFEDEPPAEPPKKRGPGRPPKPESERKRRPKKTGRLWEFIRNLLLDPKTCPSLLRWEDAHAGIFRIVQSDAIANKWGMRKNNENMNYEKLSRAMRYYYKAKIFEPVLGKRLVYKFGSNAKGWRPLNPNNPNFQNY